MGPAAVVGPRSFHGCRSAAISIARRVVSMRNLGIALWALALGVAACWAEPAEPASPPAEEALGGKVAAPEPTRLVAPQPESPQSPAILPAPHGHVTDMAGLLAPDERAAIERLLAEFRARTHHELAVLVVETTEPETIEEFSIRHARAWGLGREGVDDGLLVVVAEDDRTARIEVGIGLEGRVSDELADRIMRDDFVPAFRQGRWAQGLEAGLRSLMDAAE